MVNIHNSGCSISKDYYANLLLQEFKTGRGLRTSPIFPKLRDAGARFNQVWKSTFTGI